MPSGASEPRIPLTAALEAAYRGALTEADAYRAVRSALRVERGVLRVGNRFLLASRFREVAFVALGSAAESMAHATVDALGSRVTSGFVASPRPVERVPFRSAVLPGASLGTAAGRAVLLSVRELLEELGERDLLVVLLSPGALGGLVEPPTGADPRSLGEVLDRLRATGVPAADRLRTLRLTAGGLGGGRLPSVTGAGTVATLLVDGADHGELVGAGPTVPVSAAERARAREFLGAAGALGALPPEYRRGLEEPPSTPLRNATSSVDRPVVVASPADALRGASEALASRRWTCRLAAVSLADPPAAAVDRLLERIDQVGTEAGPSGVGSRSSPAAGLAVFAGVALDVEEGRDPAPAFRAFLSAFRERRARRELAVALLRTSGEGGETPATPGVLLTGSLDHRTAELEEIPLRAPVGVTDVGAVAIILQRAADGSLR